MTDLPDRLEAAAGWSTHQASPMPDWDGLLKEAAAALRTRQDEQRKSPPVSWLTRLLGPQPQRQAVHAVVTPP